MTLSTKRSLLLSVLFVFFLSLSGYAQTPSLPETRFRPYYYYDSLSWRCVDFFDIEYPGKQGIMGGVRSDTVYVTDLLLVARDKPIIIESLIIYDKAQSSYKFESIYVEEYSTREITISASPVILNGISLNYQTEFENTRLVIYATDRSKK